MRRNRRPVGPPGRLSAYSLTETLFISLAISLAVVAVVFAFAAPGVAVLVAATLAAGWGAVAVARRLTLSRPPAAGPFTVRIPLTDRCLEV